MSAPLYFLPKLAVHQLAPCGKLSRELLRERGLAEAWADVEDLRDVAYCEVIGAGPDGGPGLVVTALPVHSRQPPRRMGYVARDDAVQWTQAGERLWIGLDVHAPPAPADLARRRPLAGHQVRLADGQEWTVPVLRRYPGGQPGMPRRMSFDRQGSFRLELDERYQALWERTERVARLFLAPESPDFGSIDLDEACRIALEALALNYRLGPADIGPLGLLDTETWEPVLWAMIDGPKIREALAEIDAAAKKNAPPPGPAASGSGTPGGAAASPTIDPAAASCT